MAKVASPAACIAAVAALFLSGIGVGLPNDSASAEDNCASAPAAAAPAGQHWYYRIDRVKQRKCWYLHAIMALTHHAATKHSAAPAEPVASESAAAVATPQLPVAAAPQLPFAATPQPAFAAIPQLPYAATPQAANAAAAPQLAAEPSSAVVASQPAPHVTVLAIRPAASFAGTASASQAATPEQTGEPPMSQIAPNSANAAVDAVAKPAAGANAASAPGATDAHLALAPADAAAMAAARTHLAHVFFLLALAFGTAAVLIAFCGRIAGRTRAPRHSRHPDDAWRRDIHQDDAPFLAPREPYEAADRLDAHERIEPSPPKRANIPAARRRGGEPRRSEPVGTNLKDIELALRALREARQSTMQT